MVVGFRVGSRIGGAEGKGGMEAAEVREPGFQNVRGNEVDLVEDEDEALGAAGVGGDLVLCGDGTGSEGIASVEDVEEDIGLGEDGGKEMGVGTRGIVEGGGLVGLDVVVSRLVFRWSITRSIVVLCGSSTSGGEESGHWVGLVNVVVLFHFVMIDQRVSIVRHVCFRLRSLIFHL